MPVVRLVNLQKRFGAVTAVDGVSLEVAEGNIHTLLGPSGCGKTTTLRCIAGLEQPDGGEVVIGGKIMAAPERGIFVPPERRGLGMVFQSYALWPHLTVYENIASVSANRSGHGPRWRPAWLRFSRSLSWQGLSRDILRRSVAGSSNA